MKKSINLIGLFLMIIMLSSFRNNPPAKLTTANLEVKVNIAKKQPGIIKLALCKDAKTFLDKLYLEGTIKTAANGNVSYIFKNVPVGVYAVRIFQDADGDGKLSSNLFGIPNEPYGFSLNPKSRFGPPSFKEASFELNTNMSLTINLAKLEF